MCITFIDDAVTAETELFYEIIFIFNIVCCLYKRVKQMYLLRQRHYDFFSQILQLYIYFFFIYYV